jgi:6-pyruvoyltetrahydropterin/6-carboxytetrahydropterin synthase
MFRVTRRYEFAASHRLHSGALSEEENRRLYGKCNNPYGHGHNYVVEVTARGPRDGATGRAVDVALLDELVRREVVRPLDHRNLNREVAVFAGAAPIGAATVRERLPAMVPTSENLGFEVCRRLKRNWKQVFPGEWPKLEKIRIGETTRNIFEVRADEIE